MINKNINDVYINNLKFSLLTKTKDIVTYDIEEQESDNILRFNGYTDEITIKVYKEQETQVTIDTSHTDLLVYENNELTAMIIPKIGSNGSGVNYNVSYQDDTLSIMLEEEADIEATIEFAVTSTNKIFHIGNVYKNEYWLDTTAKEIFKIDSYGSREVVAKHNFIAMPYLAPKMLSSSKIFYGEILSGDIYKINEDKTLTLESSSVYRYLISLPNDLFIGLKFSSDYYTITYDLVSYKDATGFTVHDSYTIAQTFEVSSAYTIPIVTSVDSQGKNINVCFYNNSTFDLRTDIPYSATIDLGKPTFDFTKSTNGLAILKEAGPGPRVYYDFSSRKLFIGSISAGSSIQPILGQTDLLTVFATTSYSTQVKKMYNAYKHDGTALRYEYNYNSVSGTAYTVTIANSELNKYEYIDLSIPKITEHINETNTIPLSNSEWYYSEAELENVLNIENKALFKGPQGLYSKRLLSWTLASMDLSGLSYMYNLYTVKDNLAYTRGTATTDNIMIDMGEYGIGCAQSQSIFVLEKIESIPVTISLDTKRTVKKTYSIDKHLATIRKVTTRFRNDKIKTKRVVSITKSTRVPFTIRKIVKGAIRKLDTQRDVLFYFNRRVNIDTSRKIAAFIEKRCRRVTRFVVQDSMTFVRHISRKVIKTKILKLDTLRIYRGGVIVRAETRRTTIKSVETTIQTRRQVVAGKEATWKWIDTKLIITNNMRSRGPLLRKVAINKTICIKETLRPVVWIYKENDGKPIYLDTKRTLHKSINSKIKTLRRVEHNFSYETSINAHRSIVVTGSAEIKTNRVKVKQFSHTASLERIVSKSIELNNESLRAISNTYSTTAPISRYIVNRAILNINSIRQVCCKDRKVLETIRRVNKDGGMCCNTTLVRRVIKNHDFESNVARNIVQTKTNKIATERYTAIDYMSGYAFTKRCISMEEYASIDVNRKVVEPILNELDANRQIVDYHLTKSSTERQVAMNNTSKSATERQIAINNEVEATTERHIAINKEKDVDMLRHIVLSKNKDLDIKREIVSENIIFVDTIKKVSQKYIYINSIGRLVVHNKEKNIDTNREVEAHIDMLLDTTRKVRNKKAATTLFSNFVLRKGLLYEVDHYYEEVDIKLL